MSHTRRAGLFSGNVLKSHSRGQWLDSRLGRSIGGVELWFPSVSLRKLRGSTSIIPQSFRFRSFTVHHSPIVLTFGAMQFGTLTDTSLKVNHYNKSCTKLLPLNGESRNYVEDLHMQRIKVGWILKEQGRDIWTEFNLIKRAGNEQFDFQETCLTF
jgi:hypothetical protein